MRILKKFKAVFWDSYIGISVFAVIFAAALGIINLFFIDWNAFVYHGIAEGGLSKGTFLFYLIHSFQYIIYGICLAMLIFNALVVILKINRVWSKILAYLSILLSLVLIYYTLFFAFGLQESLKEFIIYHIYHILFGAVFVFLLIFFINRSKFKNKAAAVIAVTAIIGISVLPFIPKSYFSFRSDPVVFDGGDSYVIAWTTTGKALSWIDAEINGNTYKIYDQTNAVANVNSKYHRVSVPKVIDSSPVESFSYTVNSKKLLWRSAAFYKYGREIKSKVYCFSLQDSNPDLNAGVFSDVHGQYKLANKVKEYMGVCDFYIMLGDLATAVFTEDKALRIVDFAGSLSKGERLVYPVRGNHETRGTYHHLWNEYVVTPTGKFYFTISMFGLNIVVLDTGDDYSDSSPINGGASFWEENTRQQLDWLDTLTIDASKWLVAVSHINFMYDDMINNGIGAFAAPLKSMGADLLIHGHKHRIGNANFLAENSYETVLFPTYAVGGYRKSSKEYAASKITFADDKITMAQYDFNGKIRAYEELSADG